MRRSLLTLSIVLATVMAPAAQRGVVRIHVVDLDSGVPILRARLASASAVPLPTVVGDEHGDALVDVPGAGRTIRVSKPGYVPVSVPLTADADLVAVRLPRGAAISGRVIDRLGAPVAGRLVQVSANGDRTPPRTAKTDDLGEYRVGTLAQGSYTVSLGPPGIVVSGTASVTFSTPNPDALAHLVVLRRGDEVGGIDFTISPGVSCRPQELAPQPGNAYGYGSIIGRVTTAAGTPIPCVSVVAFRGSTRVSSTVTDVDGRFALSRLRAGTYPIEFARAGHVTLQWGQDVAGRPGRPVALREGEALRNIDIKLPRGGAITGAVVDEYGEPVENVMVHAMRLLEGDGRTIAIPADPVPTDDRGRYRIYGLLPGRYVVGSIASDDRPDPRTGTGYAPAYYPGTVDVASATRIDVEEEREYEGIVFPRVPTRVATVTGTAVNSRNEPVTDRVLLVASQRSGAVIAGTLDAEVKGPDGAFTIPNVPPGDYVIQATSKQPGGEAPEFGMRYLTVYEDDPLPVQVKTALGVDLRGRLMQDGRPLVDPRSFALVAVPLDWDQTSLLAGPTTLTPADDGSLAMSGVTGPRRFVLTAGPSDWYLKSVHLRGLNITDEAMGFPMLGFMRDLEVVVSNKGAVLSGDSTGGTSPAGDYSVLLFSSNPDHWFRNSRMVKATRASGAGKFRMTGIADGDYFVVAIDPLDGTAAGAWQEREFLQSLTLGARRIRLREGDDKTMALTVTHR